MADIVHMIRRDVEDDGLLKVHGFTVDLEKKGLLRRHQTLVAGGTVHSALERDKLEKIIRHHAGDAYELEMDIKVEEPA